MSLTPKIVVSTSWPLEILDLDLFGLTQVASLGRMRYCFVFVDNFSPYTWVYFLMLKSESFEIFKVFVKKIKNEKNLKVVKIHSDHGGEFVNEDFEKYCLKNGYSQNFSAPSNTKTKWCYR